MARSSRRALTLIELLIVIALIGMIGSALAYNLAAGLNKGKEFKTEQTKRKIKNILEYEMFNNHRSPDELESHWQDWVKESALMDRNQNFEEFFKDGHGGEFRVVYDERTGQLQVYSSKQLSEAG